MRRQDRRDERAVIHCLAMRKLSTLKTVIGIDLGDKKHVIFVMDDSTGEAVVNVTFDAPCQLRPAGMLL